MTQDARKARDTDIAELFPARLNFYEAGAALYQGLVLTIPRSIEQDEHQDELDMYRAQAAALMMGEPELKQTNAGGGMDGAAASDEIDRRELLTHHQAMQEAAERTRIKREREIQSPDLRVWCAFRGVDRDGVER